MSNGTYYRTYSLDAAIFLTYCNPESFIGATKESGGRCFFEFADHDEQCESLVRVFHRSDSVDIVNVKALIDCAHHVKRQLHKAYKA